MDRCEGALHSSRPVIPCLLWYMGMLNIILSAVERSRVEGPYCCFRVLLQEGTFEECSRAGVVEYILVDAISCLRGAFCRCLFFFCIYQGMLLPLRRDVVTDPMLKCCFFQHGSCLVSCQYAVSFVCCSGPQVPAEGSTGKCTRAFDSYFYGAALAYRVLFLPSKAVVEAYPPDVRAACPFENLGRPTAKPSVRRHWLDAGVLVEALCA